MKSQNHEKTALITGVTGQDGSYLSEFLLEKGYKVIGLRKRSSTVNTERIDHLYKDPQTSSKFLLEYGDLGDMTSLTRVISAHKPDEIYNFAAQSHVRISFENPAYTLDSIANGLLYLLETVKSLELDKTKIYQASTSELFGGINMPKTGYDEESRMQPMSPYGAAKQYAYSLSRIYRDAYGMHVSNGILFNHESPRRGKNFVSRKVAIGIAKCVIDEHHCLYMGNLDSLRDWGHAKDYVRAMHAITQQEIHDDYIIATGTQYSVRNLIEKAFEVTGENIKWEGKGIEEKGFTRAGRCVVRIDPRYFRPLEVNTLLGDARKAKNKLCWTPKITFDAMVREMVEYEINNSKKTNMNKANKELRETIIRTLFETGTGHLGGSLSCIDFIYEIYNTMYPEIQMIMSKGHASLAIYATIDKVVLKTEKILSQYGKSLNGKYHGHISKKVDKTIALSSGSLGHGFPYALGLAEANARFKRNIWTVCILGDGEAQEGTTWESLLIMKNLHQDAKLILAIDNNLSQRTYGNLQIKGIRALAETNEIDTYELNGNDTREIPSVLEKINQTNKKCIVIFNTIKGSGIKSIENQEKWHAGKIPSKEIEESMIKELWGRQ